jgi:hypothetical protein
METPPNPTAPPLTPSYYPSPYTYQQQQAYPVENSSYYYPQMQPPSSSHYIQQPYTTVEFNCELCKNGGNAYYPIVSSIRPCSKVHFFHSTCLQSIFQESTCRFCSPLIISPIAEKTIPFTPTAVQQQQTIIVQPDIQHIAQRKKRIILAIVCFIFGTAIFVSVIFGFVNRN